MKAEWFEPSFLALVEAARERGLLVLPAGEGDVLRMVPPLVVSEAEVAEAVDWAHRGGVHSIPLFVFSLPALGLVGGPFRAGAGTPFIVNGSMDAQLFYRLFERMLELARRQSPKPRELRPPAADAEAAENAAAE